MPDWQAWKARAQEGLQQAKEQASRTAALAQEHLHRNQLVQRRQLALRELGERLYTLPDTVRAPLGSAVDEAWQAVRTLDEELAAVEARITALETAGTTTVRVCSTCGHPLADGVKFCSQCGSPC